MTSTGTVPVSKSGLGTAILIAAAAFLFFAALTPAMQLWDRDETYYARTALEMLRTGDWLLPRFNGTVFAHKPPLMFWFIAESVSIFGENEFAYRLPSVLGQTLTLLFTFLIGRRLFSARVGHWSMIILATALMPAYLAASAQIDSLLLATIAMSTWCWLALREASGRGTALVWTTLLALAVGLMLLAKGPVGPAILSTTILCTWIFGPAPARPTLTEFTGLVAAAVAGIALFLVWAIPANAASGGEMLDKGVGIHILGRAFTPMEGHGGSGIIGYLATLPVYLPVLFIGFIPWAIDLPGVLASGTSTATDKPARDRRFARAVLVGWAGSTFILFTLVATKLPHYILPMFPPIAILLAALHVSRSKAPPHSQFSAGFWSKATAATLVAMQTGSAIALVALAFFLPTIAAKLASATAAILIMGSLYFFLRLRANGKFERAHHVAAASMAAFLAIIYWGVAPQIETFVKPMPTVEAAIAAHQLGDLPVYVSGKVEPSVILAVDPPAFEAAKKLADPQAGIVELAARGEEAVVLVIQRASKKLHPEQLGNHAVIVSQQEFFDINGGGRRSQVQIVHVNDGR